MAEGFFALNSTVFKFFLNWTKHCNYCVYRITIWIQFMRFVRGMEMISLRHITKHTNLRSEVHGVAESFERIDVFKRMIASHQFLQSLKIKYFHFNIKITTVQRCKCVSCVGGIVFIQRWLLIFALRCQNLVEIRCKQHIFAIPVSDFACETRKKASGAKMKRMVLICNENVQQRPFRASVVLVRWLDGAGTSLIMCQLFSFQQLYGICSTRMFVSFAFFLGL